MKKNLFKLSKRGLLLMASFAMLGSAQSQTATFNFNGGLQTFTVPCGVTSVFVQAWGAQGGSGATGGGAVAGGSGGLGGYAEGFLTVTPGDVLNVFVGGQGATPTGGFNGGANGGTQNAGGGGGATDVRVGGTAEANRVITAGGGGGGGRGGCDEGSATTAGIGGNGGIGGGGVGTNGNDSPTSGGVAGGGKGGNFASVQGAFGPAGVGCGGFLGSPGSTATTGTGANGGGGQSCCCSSGPSIPGGGGGGGGQIGGGGGGGGSAGTTGCSGNSKGAGGGGGGGSSFVGGVTSGVVNNGIWLGNGQVTISWTSPVPPNHVVSGDLSSCEGDAISYSIPADAFSTFYTWTVPAGIDFISGQNTTSISASGVTPGNYTIYVYGVNGTCSLLGPVDSIEVVVNPTPVVGLTASQAGALCAGELVTLTGTPAGGTYAQVSGPAVALTGNQFNASQSGNYSIEYSFSNGFGCSATAALPIVVNDNPVVGLTASQLGTVCGGTPITLTGSPAGGTYSQASGPAPAVTGNIFNATLFGNYSIEYDFTDGNGCSATAALPLVVNCFLDITEIDFEGHMSVFPNPSKGTFSVTSKSEMNGSIEVFDLNGQRVHSENVQNVNNKEVTVKSVSAGTYILKITSDNVTYTGKITIVE